MSIFDLTTMWYCYRTLNSMTGLRLSKSVEKGLMWSVPPLSKYHTFNMEDIKHALPVSKACPVEELCWCFSENAMIAK